MNDTAPVRFTVLGQLTITVGDQQNSPGGPKKSIVLAALLLHANTVVSVDALTEMVWGETPPDGARSTLQVYISNLRRLLADAGANTADYRSDVRERTLSDGSTGEYGEGEYRLLNWAVASVGSRLYRSRLENLLEEMREQFHDAFDRAQTNLWRGEADLEPWLGTARLLAMNSPLNPTGTCISREALRGICEAIVEDLATDHQLLLATNGIADIELVMRSMRPRPGL